MLLIIICWYYCVTHGFLLWSLKSGNLNESWGIWSLATHWTMPVHGRLEVSERSGSSVKHWQRAKLNRGPRCWDWDEIEPLVRHVWYPARKYIDFRNIQNTFKIFSYKGTVHTKPVRTNVKWTGMTRGFPDNQRHYERFAFFQLAHTLLNIVDTPRQHVLSPWSLCFNHFTLHPVPLQDT